jgi:hypothetical protein
MFMYGAVGKSTQACRSGVTPVVVSTNGQSAYNPEETTPCTPI